MAERPNKENQGSSGSSSGSQEDRESSRGTIDLIRDLASAHARAPLDSDENILLFLKSWWSRTYNRPLKDPLLQEYTVEELMYEFFDRIERAKAAEEATEQESDKIEEEKEKAVLDWAEQEELRELEEMKREGEASIKSDPTKDPENIKWMEEQMAAHKEKFGDDFGDDISESFE